ncbi:PAS domain-containing protein [Streptomyces sp. 891-h]|uniref:PAS domain-containing protein n=1 Tax=Streptomyces sp. 891-h TaxID=2720714 RepID=UPI00205A8BA7|nr:PAS domain-containing protein [Streptomyces sp. 891-h]UNZ18747.1 PAS domain-containing protein [Streptomyces sp. 891-h]
MAARSETHSASSSDGDGGPDDELLLAALLDGMDAALCAFDADGVVTHWNREAERMLGWTQEEAVGRKGLAGWAVRPADAEEVEGRLLDAMRSPGRQVHEFALLTKDGGRVLVRIQSSGVSGADGRPKGVYCAFSEVHAQIDLERCIALSEALLEDASWGVVLVDADLRPTVVNAYAARAFRVPARAGMLGRPLGELLEQGMEELEGALQHVLGEGAPPAPAEIWVTLRAPSDRTGTGRTGTGTGPADGESGDGADPASAPGEAAEGDTARMSDGEGRAAAPTAESARRRCWRSGFLRLSSPLAEEPVPLGVAWLFQDATDQKQAEREAARLRFRDGQSHRAARAAAECADPMEAACLHLEFALAGFADHALLDLTADPGPEPSRTQDTSLDALPPRDPRLVRAALTPAAERGRPPFIEPGTASGIPVAYPEGHPALQAYQRCTSVRASCGAQRGPDAAEWARTRKWPQGTVHGLCTVLRCRGRSLGVVTFLRDAGRRPFDREDADYAEQIATHVAAAVDLAGALGSGHALGDGQR